jgi:iron complex transport system permease protein
MSNLVIADNNKYGKKFLVLAVIFVSAFLTSFMLGRYPVDPLTLIRILLYGAAETLSKVLPDFLPRVTEKPWADAAETVILRVRLPRVVAAALIGAALSAAGAAYQGMFRNPMVSPDILGASSGAGFGAALAILLYRGYLGISAAAFFTGLCAVLLAWFISRRSRIDATLAMVLSGMMVSSLFSAATSFVKLIADTEEVLPAITYWLMGSLASIRGRDVLLAAVPIIPGLIVLLLLRWRLNLLTLTEDEAKAMGADTARLRVTVILCATLLTAASVAVSGLIGWVGLVIPHFCRLIFGHDYSRLIPAACVFGAAFLILVDDAARLIATSEIPIGILTAFIGAPVFLWLILRGGGDDG